ncbi:MAG: hypothetical protein ABI169_10025 [Chitinophagaceae bacterium]
MSYHSLAGQTRPEINLETDSAVELAGGGGFYRASGWYYRAGGRWGHHGGGYFQYGGRFSRAGGGYCRCGGGYYLLVVVILELMVQGCQVAGGIIDVAVVTIDVAGLGIEVLMIFLNVLSRRNIIRVVSLGIKNRLIK